MNKIQRYILRETYSPFLVGFLFFTLLFVAPRLKPLVGLAIEKNIPVDTVLKLLIYSIPSTMVLTIPMGTLFGCLFSLGRLSSDSEIIAMRSSGISLWSICKPIIAFSVFMTVFLFFFFNFVMSQANLNYKTLYANAVYASPGILLQKNSFVQLPGTTKKITALSFDDKTQEMESVYIYDRKNQSEDTLIYARKGYFLSNEVNSQLIKLELQDGEMIQINEQKPSNIERVSFKRMEVNVFTKVEQIDLAEKGLREQSYFEVAEFIEMQRKNRMQIQPVTLVELHKKVSLPLACLAFAMVAIPLSITRVRSGKGASLGMSIVFILIYYFFLSLGEALGKSGQISPEIGMHMPNVVIGVIGILLFLRKLKD